MDNKRTWIYCRTARPDAHALMMQQRALEEYAQKNDLCVVGTTIEQASGFNYCRRGLSEVFTAVETGKTDSLLVLKLSCLGRDTVKTDACLRWLEERLVEVICADGTVPQTTTDILLNLMSASGVSPH